MANLKKLKNLVSYDFFLEVQRTGSSIPTVFNKNFLHSKNYNISKQDIFTGGLWQKANKRFISNKDEESAKRFINKYKLS